MSSLGRLLILTHLAAIAAILLGLTLYFTSADIPAKAILATAISGLVTAVAISLIVKTLLRSAARPFQEFRRAAQALANGELSYRMTSSPHGYEGISEAFNRMASSAQEVVEQASLERDRLIAALDSGIDGVLALDKAGRMAFVNAAAARLLERSRQDIIGRPLLWALPEQKAADSVQLALSERRHTFYDWTGPGQRQFQIFTTPILGEGDWAALIVFHDVTEVKRAESIRRDFVANVSHELRTPLAAIKSVIETLQAGALDDPKLSRDFLVRMDGEVDRLTQMVEELLELSRIEAGVSLTKRPVNLPELLQEATVRMAQQAQRGNVALTLEIQGDIPEIQGDSRRLEQVIINLVHNAIKFTPAGGQIRITASREDTNVIIRVSDTGVGIAAGDLPRVFERFYKADRARHGAGTGLGLALVKHAAQAHGGEVLVQSEMGKGSTFTVVLPLEADPATSGSN